MIRHQFMKQKLIVWISLFPFSLRPKPIYINVKKEKKKKKKLCFSIKENCLVQVYQKDWLIETIQTFQSLSNPCSWSVDLREQHRHFLTTWLTRLLRILLQKKKKEEEVFFTIKIWLDSKNLIEVLLFVFVGKQVLIKFTQPEREKRKKKKKKKKKFKLTVFFNNKFKLTIGWWWSVFYMFVSLSFGNVLTNKN